MGKYWTDKEDYKDFINAIDFNDAFSNIESDIETKVDKVEGKGLIDSDFAQNIDSDLIQLSSETNSVSVDPESIVLKDLTVDAPDDRKSVKIKDDLISIIGDSMDECTQIENDSITITDSLGGRSAITPGEIVVRNYGSGDVGTLYPTYLNLSDTAKYRDSGITLSDTGSASELNISVNGGVKIENRTLGSTEPAEIETTLFDTSGNVTESHKLTEKANQSDLESLSDSLTDKTDSMQEQINEITYGETTETSVLDNSSWSGSGAPNMYNFVWYKDSSKNDITGIYIYGYSGIVCIADDGFVSQYTITTTESRDKAVNIVESAKFKEMVSYCFDVTSTDERNIVIYPNDIGVNLTIDKVSRSKVDIQSKISDLEERTDTKLDKTEFEDFASSKSVTTTVTDEIDNTDLYNSGMAFYNFYTSENPNVTGLYAYGYDGTVVANNNSITIKTERDETAVNLLDYADENGYVQVYSENAVVWYIDKEICTELATTQDVSAIEMELDNKLDKDTAITFENTSTGERATYNEKIKLYTWATTTIDSTSVNVSGYVESKIDASGGITVDAQNPMYDGDIILKKIDSSTFITTTHKLSQKANQADVDAIPKIFEEDGELFVNVGDKKYKLTATEA